MEDEKIQIAGFGTLDAKIVDVPETTRYNPATGQKETFKEHKTVRAHFKPAKEFKEQIFAFN